MASRRELGADLAARVGGAVHVAVRAAGPIRGELRVSQLGARGRGPFVVAALRERHDDAAVLPAWCHVDVRRRAVDAGGGHLALDRAVAADGEAAGAGGARRDGRNLLAAGEREAGT